MNKIIKLTTFLLSFTAALAFSNSATATVSPNGGENWGGTQGINTPTLWTEGHGNVVGSHFMRMTVNADGSRMMDPNGMLMQHHFANHDGTGASNPGLTSSISGAEPGASEIIIDLDNFTPDGSFSVTNMRVEVLSFNDASDAVASITSAVGTGSGVTHTEPFTQANATWTNPGGMQSTWDYTYTDFVLNGAAPHETITIDPNGTNIGQVFVWTEQIAADVSAVPVPAAVWLFGTAMAGLFTASRRRNISTATAA